MGHYDKDREIELKDVEVKKEEKFILKIGIDPGLNGGIAFIYMNEEETEIKNANLFTLPKIIQPWTKPTKSKKSGKIIHTFMLDVVSIIKLTIPRVLDRNKTKVQIEKVHSMPGQGVKSTFTFGQSFGTLLGVFQTLGLKVKVVSPRDWKKRFDFIKKDKDFSRKQAIKQYPLLKEYLEPVKGKFDKSEAKNRADAFWIGLF